MTNSKVVQTCSIKKFWFEIGELYTVIINLEKKLESIQQMYTVSLHSANEDQQLIKDQSAVKITFRWFVLRTSDFKEIKFKIDWEVIKKLIDIKHKDLEKIWITLESQSL